MDPEEPTQESQQDPNEATQNSAFSFGESGNTAENTLGAQIPDSQDQSVISPTPVHSAPVPARNINAGSFLGSQISRSDLLSTQLSVDSRHSGAVALRRGDIQPTGALEKYLNSEVQSEIRPTSPGFLSSQVASQGQDEFGAAPVIWGTTINIEDSMGMFRDFINNYTKEEENVPFYPTYLEHVKFSIQ